MNADSARVKSIFLNAVEHYAPTSWSSYLDQECGGNAALRIQVDQLLAGHQCDTDLAQDAAAAFQAALPELGQMIQQDQPGTVIGSYKLLELIGEGGFGLVYVAEQQRPMRRKVALKVLKPGLDSREIIGRFEAERQALAMMDHPNIAKVFDAGTTEDGARHQRSGADEPQSVLSLPPDTRHRGFFFGRPYFVMELVLGVSITEYCDRCHLTPRERLELFLTVCQAVQHAHQKGVIHRDLKPNNVLVTMQNGRPVPKIIDFGVAKAIDQRLTECTLSTGFAQMIGTPLYMSPEQAALSPLGVDTRSDIYSLGVLLYELLTGTTPFDKTRLHAASYDEMRQIIREEDPPRPSARISTLRAELATTVADQRRTDPQRLQHLVRGELDWVVMKCLEKDRNRRYESAGNLARDIERHLNNEPVQACPPSAAYRLRKFARRNSGLLAATGMVAAALVLGTLLSVSQAVRARRAEHVAEAARIVAETNAVKARQAVDDMYTQVAERWLAHQPQMEPIQREFLHKALRFYSESADREGTETPVRLETARAYHRVAEIQHRLGKSAAAEDAYRAATAKLQQLADDFPTVPEYRSELSNTLHRLGVLFGDIGRYDEEEQVHRRALALDERQRTEFPSSDEVRRRLGRGHWYVGQVLLAMQRRTEAEQELRLALAIQLGLVDTFHADREFRFELAQTYLRLGLAIRYLEQLEEYFDALTNAADLLETLADEFPTLPEYRNELANVYYWQVYFCRKRNLPLARTEQYLNRAIVLQEKLVADFPSVTDYRYDWFRSHKTLGRILMKAGQPERAETALRQAIVIAESLAAEVPTVHYYRSGLATVHISLGELLTTTDRPSEAEMAFREAIRLLNDLAREFPTVPQYGRYLAQTYSNLGAIYETAGRTTWAAEAHYRAERFSSGHAGSLVRTQDSIDMELDEFRKADTRVRSSPSTIEN